MGRIPHWAATLCLALCAVAIAHPMPGDGEKPALHVPKILPTRADLAHTQALRLYGVGVLMEKRNRLIEALGCYEKAAKLAPDQAAIKRALVPLYLALDRSDDALSMGRAVLKLDPNDSTTAALLGRQMRVLGRKADAVAMLRAASKSKSLSSRPDQAAQVWFELAMLLEQDGDLAHAEAGLRKVAVLLDNPRAMMEASHASREEVDQQCAETYERLGQICLKRKKVAAAVAAFAVARKKDPIRAPRLAYDLARVYRDQGKKAQALTQVEAYLASSPAGVEAYEMRIALQKETGATSKIVPSLRASVNDDPHNLALKLLLGRELRLAKQGREAGTLYAEILKINPTTAVFKGMFALRAEQGESGASAVLARLDTSIRAAVGTKDEPGSPGEATAARSMLGVLREMRGLTKAVLGQAAGASGAKLHFATQTTLARMAGKASLHETAEKLYRACLDAHASELGAMETETYAGLLTVLQIQHKNEAVLALAKQGLARGHKSNRILFHRSMAYALLNLDRMKEALEAAEAAVAEADKGQLLGSRKLKAYVLGEMGKGEEAVRECQSLLKDYNQGSELREARLALSRAYQSAGKLVESEAELEKAMAGDPTDATICNDLGYGYADRGKKLDEAVRLIRKAIELDKKERASGLFADPDAGLDNAAYVDSLGWALFRQGKLDEARKELERATRLPHGDDPVMWDHLGDVYYKLKLKTKAVEAWKRAVAQYEAGARRQSETRHKELREKLRQAEK